MSNDFSGSLGGGGRYDNLVGMFRNNQVPAVGLSLGLERVLLLIDDRDLFPDLPPPARVMTCNLPRTPLQPAIELLSSLRAAGIPVNVHSEQTKLKRQLAATRRQRMSYALIVGPDQIMRNTYTLKDLTSGEQHISDEAALIRPFGSVPLKPYDYPELCPNRCGRKMIALAIHYYQQKSDLTSSETLGPDCPYREWVLKEICSKKRLRIIHEDSTNRLMRLKALSTREYPRLLR